MFGHDWRENQNWQVLQLQLMQSPVWLEICVGNYFSFRVKFEHLGIHFWNIFLIIVWQLVTRSFDWVGKWWLCDFVKFSSPNWSMLRLKSKALCGLVHIEVSFLYNNSQLWEVFTLHLTLQFLIICQTNWVFFNVAFIYTLKKICY